MEDLRVLRGTPTRALLQTIAQESQGAGETNISNQVHGRAQNAKVGGVPSVMPGSTRTKKGWDGGVIAPTDREACVIGQEQARNRP